MRPDAPLRPSSFRSFGLSSAHGPVVLHRTDRHNEVELNFVQSGAFRPQIGGSSTLLAAGRLAVFWAVAPHRVMEADEGTMLSVLRLPLADFLQWKLPSALKHRVLHGEFVVEPDGSHAAVDGAAFLRWHDDLQAGSNHRREALVLEVQARLVRLGLSLSEEITGPTKPVIEQADKVEQMTSLIAQHYAEPLTISDIAQAVGLHPNYAMTLFRKSCGMSLGECLTQQRLHHAQRLLVTSDAKILTIAMEAGFGSVSQFYSVFKRVCGGSPKTYRISQRP